LILRSYRAVVGEPISTTSSGIPTSDQLEARPVGDDRNTNRSGCTRCSERRSRSAGDQRISPIA
jgi:hypothetical protein